MTFTDYRLSLVVAGRDAGDHGFYTAAERLEFFRDALDAHSSRDEVTARFYSRCIGYGIAA